MKPLFISWTFMFFKRDSIITKVDLCSLSATGRVLLWCITALAGVVSKDPLLQKSISLNTTPILDRFRTDSSKETYLPTLQALPGRVEFTYLPPNTQGALLLPVPVTRLGTDTAKSFTPRDVAWCQVLASRIGAFLDAE